MGIFDMFKRDEEEDDSQAFVPSMEEAPEEVAPAPKSYDKAPLASGIKKEEQTAAQGFEEVDTAAPSVKDYIAKKYNLAEQYEGLAKDNADVKSARNKAATRNKVVGVMQGLSQAFAGKENTLDGVYDAQREASADIVKAAEGDRKHRLAEFLTAGELRKNDDEANAKDADRSELKDPNSNKSQVARNLGLSRVTQLSNEALKAGDTAGAAQLKALGERLRAGDMSASDVGDMKLLDKVDYKDVLNNQAAMARVQATESGANRRTEMQVGAEDRRTKQQGFNMEKDLVAQIEKDPVMREAASGKIALDKAMSLAGTPAGDEALTVMWNKGIDPISVVREGEFARTAAMRGPVDRYEMALQKLKGQGTLTPEIREELKSAMRDMQVAYAPYASSKLERIQNSIDHYGLGADRVYGSFFKDVAGNNGAAGTTAAAPGAAPAKSPAAFPRTVKKGNETATVSNDEELKEAQADGFQ